MVARCFTMTISRPQRNRRKGENCPTESVCCFAAGRQKQAKEELALFASDAERSETRRARRFVQITRPMQNRKKSLAPHILAGKGWYRSSVHRESGPGK
jgi:hypothetical protein